MIKKILLTFLSTLVIMSIFAGSIAIAESAITGTGTPTDPYIMSTSEHFIALANISKTTATPEQKAIFGNNTWSTLKTKHYRLGNDVNLSSADGFTGISGFDTGSLDGANHTITLDINSESGQCGGIFNETQSRVVIKNLTTRGTVILKNVNYAGALVGMSNNCITVENCINYANVSSSASGGNYSMVAGLVGETRGLTNTFTDCVNHGTINAGAHGTSTGNSRAAGILAFARQGATFTDCKNTGSISATRPTEIADRGTLAAGIGTGGAQSLIRCENTGNISANAQSNNTAAGLCIASVSKLEHGENTGAISASAGGVHSEQVITDSNLSVVHANVLDADFGFGDKVVATFTPCIASVTNGVKYGTYTWDGNTWTLSGVTEPATPVAGSGTEEDPFILMTAAQFNELSKISINASAATEQPVFANKKKVEILDSYFKLGASVTLRSSEGFQGISNFTGVFDGGYNVASQTGHKITLDIDSTNRPTSGNTARGGIFNNTTSSPVIKNVYTEGNVKLWVNGGAGVVVGLSHENILMENCVNYANLTAGSDVNYAMVGAFVGYAMSTNERFINCTNYGNVTAGEVATAAGNTRAAGICGYAMRGAFLTNCRNEGTIVATRPVDQDGFSSIAAGLATGGIGNNHTYVDLTLVGCENKGDVSAISPRNNSAACIAIGGMKKIEDCTNTGNAKTKKETQTIINTIEIIAATNFAFNDANVFDDDFDFNKIAMAEANGTKATLSNGTETKVYTWYDTCWLGIDDYLIKYHLDGGVNDSANPATYQITTPTITLKDATKLGYLFEGWYDAEVGGTKITAIVQGTTGHKQLWARWTEGAVVTFDARGGTVSPAQVQVAVGATVAKPTDPTYTKADKLPQTFLGWYTSPDGGTTLSATAFDFGTPITANITLYSNWLDPVQAKLEEMFANTSSTFKVDYTYISEKFTISLSDSDKAYKDIANEIDFAELLALKQVKDAGISEMLLYVDDVKLRGNGNDNLINIPQGLTLVIEAKVVPTPGGKEHEPNLLAAPTKTAIAGQGNVVINTGVRVTGGTTIADNVKAGDAIALTGNGSVTVVGGRVRGGFDKNFWATSTAYVGDHGGNAISTENGDIAVGFGATIEGGYGGSNSNGGAGIVTKTGGITVQHSFVRGGNGGRAGDANKHAGNGGNGILVTGDYSGVTMIIDGEIWGGIGGGADEGFLGYGNNAIEFTGKAPALIEGTGKVYGGNSGAGHGKVSTDVSTNPDGLYCLAITPKTVKFNGTETEGKPYIRVDYTETVPEAKGNLNVKVDSANVVKALSGQGYFTAEKYDEHGNLIPHTGDIIGTKTHIEIQHDDMTGSGEKVEAAEAIKKFAAENGLTPLETLDITLSMKAKHIDGIEETINFTKTATDAPIKFVIEITSGADAPEELHVIRHHKEENGTFSTELIPSTYNKANKTITFETDKFSYFTLAGGKVDPSKTHYNIKVKIKGEGVVSPSTGNESIVKVKRGNNQVFVIMPNEGWYIDNVFVDGEAVGKVTSYEFKNVQSDHVIRVVFKEGSIIVDPSVPKTGDHSGIGLWFMLVVLSGLGLLVLGGKKLFHGGKF